LTLQQCDLSDVSFPCRRRCEVCCIGITDTHQGALIACHLAFDPRAEAPPEQPRRVFKRDRYSPIGWYPEKTTIFNIHLVNSEGACEIFGEFDPAGKDAENSPIKQLDIADQLNPLQGFSTINISLHPKTRNTIF
jgi:hypothetical protein